MSDVYFLKVVGDDSKKLADRLTEKSKEIDTASDDNIIIVPEEVEPVDRSEAETYLQEMARALGMEVTDEGNDAG